MQFEEALKQTEKSYLVQLKQAKELCNLRTLGIERKGFVAHALEWAIERQEPKTVVQTYIESDMRTFDCPRCKDTWVYMDTPEVFRYCPSCGQRLDWEGTIQFEEGE